MFQHHALHEIAFDARRDGVAGVVADAVISPIDSHRWCLATIEAGRLGQPLEFLQGKTEGKISGFRFVLVLAINRFDATHATRGFDTVMFTLCHTRKFLPETSTALVGTTFGAIEIQTPNSLGAMK